MKGLKVGSAKKLEVLIPAFLFLALASTEGLAYWWMHPVDAGIDQRVLVYQPGSAKQEKGENDPVSRNSVLTPLPDLYRQSAPMLRCSGGQVFHAELDDAVGLYLAFFEWDGTDTGSVLEAFRHLPEACMGSIGMRLVSKEKPITWKIDGETLVFDHTIFREPGQGGGVAALGHQIHAFRAVWVSGMAGSNFRSGIQGDEIERLTTIRLKSAIGRYRPGHARVIQAAVRGAASGEVAWQAFEKTLLLDLKFQ